jgi:hypothetical protein
MKTQELGYYKRMLAKESASIFQIRALKSDSVPPRESAWKPAVQGQHRDAVG